MDPVIQKDHKKGTCRECGGPLGAVSEKSGYCGPCCKAHLCGACGKTLVPSNTFAKTTKLVKCSTCTGEFRAHNKCHGRNTVCPSCMAGSEEKPVGLDPNPVPLIKLYGTEFRAAKLLQRNRCSACELTFDQARDFCKDHELDSKAKAAHCVIPQSVIKKTEVIILKFHDCLCELPVVQKARQTKASPSFRLLQPNKSLERLLSCEKLEIDRQLFSWLSAELVPGDSTYPKLTSQTQGPFYFKPSEQARLNDAYFGPVCTIIGKGNLGMFDLGTQCAMCEHFQGDLPFLERSLVLDAFLKANALAERLQAQTLAASKRFWASEVVTEKSVLEALRQGAEPRTLRHVVQAHQTGFDAYVASKFGHSVTVQISALENPLVQRWTRHLVHMSVGARRTLLAFLLRYVGLHLLNASQPPASPLDFLVGWLDTELLPELYRRLKKSDADTPCVPVRLALDLWPCFQQYYVAQILSICRGMVKLNEIDRLVSLHNKYIDEITKRNLWH